MISRKTGFVDLKSATERTVTVVISMVNSNARLYNKKCLRKLVRR